MEEEIKLFNDYVKVFDFNHDKIKSKYAHTFRVVNYAEEIAKSLNLSEDDINKAKICALFHDIGRFNQAKIYDTFEDSLSFDHGDEGMRVLEELNYNDRIVLLSTKYHNKYMVDKSLDDKTLMFCNITRDADKIDILVNHYFEANENEVISDEVFNEMFNEKLLKNNLSHNSNEEMLKGLSFIFDINYPKSFEILKENDLVNKKIDCLLKVNNDERINKVREILNNYMEKRLKEC